MNRSNIKTLSYIVGVALGDGNLSNPNGRAVRLRITCDTQYSDLIKRIRESIQTLQPNNKVSIIEGNKTYINISCYSNKWEKWLGWKVGKGSKYEQKVHVPQWIKKDKKLSVLCLKGLIETDGCIYNDRGYIMVGFVTIIPLLASDVVSMITNLGFKPNIYKFETDHKARYNIRISRDVKNFIKILNLSKS